MDLNGMLRFKRITIGIIAFLLWLLGMILPIMPGWPFLVFAIFLLSRDLPFVRPMRLWIERKFPSLVKPVLVWETKLGLLSPDELAATPARE